MARRRRIPYAFEIVVAVVLFAVFAGAWLGIPGMKDQLVGLWQRLTVGTVLHRVHGVYPDAMHVASGPDGRIWILSKYTLVRVAPDGTWETVLDSPGYKHRFGRRLNALSSLQVIGADEVWVGSWYGELFHYRAGQWRQLSIRDQPLGSRIYALNATGDGVWLATAKGLWFWSQRGHELQPVEGVPMGAVHAVAMGRGGGLVAAFGGGLWRRELNGKWSRVWQNTAAINRIEPVADGWWLGTDDGLVHVSRSGESGQHRYAGQRVRAFVGTPDGRWMAVWKGGLQWGDGFGRRCFDTDAGLPADSVTDVLLARDERLWLTVYGEGAFWLRLSDLRPRLQHCTTGK